MFGRFGIVFIIVAVLLCTGLITSQSALIPDINAFSVAGLVIMLAAFMLAAASGRIASKMKPESRERGEILLKLGSVILAAIGAIVVFCG